MEPATRIMRKLTTLGWAEMKDGSQAALVRVDATLYEDNEVRSNSVHFFIGANKEKTTSEGNQSEYFDAKKIVDEGGREFPAEWAKEILEAYGYTIQPPKEKRSCEFDPRMVN